MDLYINLGKYLMWTKADLPMIPSVSRFKSSYVYEESSRIVNE
jgi:hypothetical protein